MLAPPSKGSIGVIVKARYECFFLPECFELSEQGPTIRYAGEGGGIYSTICLAGS